MLDEALTSNSFKVERYDIPVHVFVAGPSLGAGVKLNVVIMLLVSEFEELLLFTVKLVSTVLETNSDDVSGRVDESSRADVEEPRFVML